MSSKMLGDEEERIWLWRGRDYEGIECRIAADQWKKHVAKRPEIADALELTKRAMENPAKEEHDPNRPDEAERCFRLLSFLGEGRWERHWLRVSVKLMRQSDGCWVKFYQSCCYERMR